MLLPRVLGRRRDTTPVRTLRHVRIVNRTNRRNAIITRSSYRGHVPVLLRLSARPWQPTDGDGGGGSIAAPSAGVGVGYELGGSELKRSHETRSKFKFKLCTHQPIRKYIQSSF